MKTLQRLSCLIVCHVPLASIADDKVGNHYDFSAVVELQALEERYVKDRKSYQYFQPRKTKFTSAAEVSSLRKAISEAKADEAGQGPFIGHLCHIAMLDKNEKVIAMVSILNFNCLCSIHGAHRDKEGRIVADYDKKPFGFFSEPLARAFYDRLRRDDALRMKRMDKVYQGMGKTVHELLFGIEEGEQGSARQPATAPESKPDGKEPPKPESEPPPK